MSSFGSDKPVRQWAVCRAACTTFFWAVWRPTCLLSARKIVDHAELADTPGGNAAAAAAAAEVLPPLPPHRRRRGPQQSSLMSGWPRLQVDASGLWSWRSRSALLAFLLAALPGAGAGLSGGWCP